MYSRSINEKKVFTVPPGYDGSRFRKSNRHDGEIVLVPDSGFTGRSKDDTLSVSGIPTAKGINHKKELSVSAENTASPVEDIPESDTVSDDKCDAADHTNDNRSGSKLSGILDKLGFGGNLSTDELILCALIFIIASDEDNDRRNVGDILLILALLLGLR